MSYRDDHDAALARITALEAENAALRSNGPVEVSRWLGGNAHPAVVLLAIAFGLLMIVLLIALDA